MNLSLVCAAPQGFISDKWPPTNSWVTQVREEYIDTQHSDGTSDGNCVCVCVCVCWEWDRCRETELMRCWISVVECSPGCHVRDCRLCFGCMWPLEHEAIINWFMYSVEHMCWFYGKYYWEVYCVFRVCVRLLETMCACMCKIIDWISTAFLSNNCLGIWSALVLPVHWLQSHFLVHTCTHTRS